jgi:hypothetical protein
MCYRVWEGSSTGEQVVHFNVAMGRVKDFLGQSGHSIKVEVLDLKGLRDQKLDIRDLITWLLGSHIHFAITHPHQGMEDASKCTIKQIYQEVDRLKFHPGFPSGVQLQCPIFLQDKWKYLQHVPATMRTCKIEIEEVVDYVDCPHAPGLANFVANFPLAVAQIRRSVVYICTVFYNTLYLVSHCVNFTKLPCLNAVSLRSSLMTLNLS